MSTNAEWIEKAKKVQLGNYRPAPIVLSRGSGCRVEDVEGRSYLDLTGGLAVVSVGHAHPKLARAIGEQASRLLHVSNLFYNDRAIELAEELTRRTKFSRAFFCNSGTEANEAMIKLARRSHYERGDKERVEIVSTVGSFHGRTMGALTATGQSKYHEGMGPLVGGIVHCAYSDLSALTKMVGPQTAAVILEPIQAEGGIHVGSDEYLRGVREICDRAGALLLFDEVQTGCGRTGRFLAQEWSGVVPDACSLAKGIAGGFPLGAMLVSERVIMGLPPGSHASTFGGNPLACAAALAVLKIIDEEHLVQNAEKIGDYLREELLKWVSELSSIVEIRGRGLLQGIVLSQGIDPLAQLAAIRDKGALASVVGGNVLRICPPLNITKEEIDEGLSILRSVLAEARPA